MREPLLLFWFDIAVDVRRVLVLFLRGKSISKSFDAFAKFTGDPAYATGSKKKQDNDEDNDPFRATW